MIELRIPASVYPWPLHAKFARRRIRRRQPALHIPASQPRTAQLSVFSTIPDSLLISNACGMSNFHFQYDATVRYRDSLIAVDVWICSVVFSIFFVFPPSFRRDNDHDNGNHGAANSIFLPARPAHSCSWTKKHGMVRLLDSFSPLVSG